jgi:para-nitrobenzyl esterase
MFRLRIPGIALFVASISFFTFPTRTLRKIVRIDSGLVSGRTDPYGVTAYLGIPFAAPPVGNLRWRAPQPVAAWHGVRPADHFGPSCMQVEMGIRLPWSRGFMTQGPISEDCLYLNVWTRSPANGEKLPVMVWIYGGGFSEGSSEVAVYDGANLARKGVVVVTFNYRVGPLGFLAYPALTAESRNHSSGNYGLLDQIAALRWVQRNIGAFGGDRGNVTIFGQSAGAGSVAILMTSPLATGLLTHAITESGLGRTSHPAGRKTLVQAEQQGLQYAQAMGVHSLAQLRALPATDFSKPILGAQPGLLGFGPNVDNWVVTDAVPAHEVPLINGMVANDLGIGLNYGNGQPPPPITLDSYRQELKTVCGDQIAVCLKLYPAHNGQQASVALITALRDRARVSIYLWAVGQAKRGPVYTYFFDRAEPWPQHPQFGAFHTSEVPYVFDSLTALHRAWTLLDFKVANEMSSYWSNFAKTGDPNSAGLPRWPAFHTDSHTTMELGARMGPMPVASSPAALRFFLKYLGK